MSSGKRRALLMGLAVACALGIGLSFVIGGSSAAPKRDRDATEGYLAARGVFAEQLERARTRRTAVVKAYVAEIAATCSAALRDAPTAREEEPYRQQGSKLVLAPRTALFLDATLGIEQTMRVSDGTAIKVFTRRVRGLRWADSDLTKLVQAFADAEDAQLEGEVPNLCEDARAWSASGFRAVPAHPSDNGERIAATRATLTRQLASAHCRSPYPGPAILHVLQRATPSANLRTAQEISAWEMRYAIREGLIVENALAQIENVLGTRLRMKSGTNRTSGRAPTCVDLPAPLG